MTYQGRVTEGRIVLEGTPTLPEGAGVRVELVESTPETSSPGADPKTLGSKLLKFAGKAVGLPADAARNHDHYLYGAPRK